MIQQSTLSFLKQLAKNNNKPWFDAHRKDYETAKADFLQCAQQIINGVGKFDAPVGGLDAKKCMFRINRDIRFSKNKSPYKTNLAASFNKGGKKIMTGGYYFHLEPGKSFVAGGIYMPEPQHLAKVRQEIDYNWPAFKKIITSKTFKTLFGDLSKDDDIMLSRPPKGYDANNPAIEYLKLKSFVVVSPLKDDVVTSAQLIKQALAAYKAMRPFIEFIETAMEA